MKSLEFIRDQGENIGNAEFGFRLRALEYSAFRAFGGMASTIRVSARLAWVQPSHPSADFKRNLHLVAKRKG